MSRLQQVIRETRKSLDSYDFDQAANTLYQFIWHEFCDWYLELIKPQLYDKEDAATRRHCQSVLLKVLSAVLRLLHPFTPFMTEEIWQKLPGAQGSIMVAPYPQPEPQFDHPEAEAEMNLVMATITAIRNIRGEMNVPPGTQVEVFLHSPEAGAIETLNRHRQSIQILGRVQDLHCNAADGPPAAAAKAVVDAVDIFMPLTGHHRLHGRGQAPGPGTGETGQRSHPGPTQNEQRRLPGQGPGRSRRQRTGQTPGPDR